MEPLRDRETSEPNPPANAGVCPRCSRPVEWVPVDDKRRGKACRHCGWVELPEIVVVRHNVNTVLRIFFPRSRLAAAVDFAILWLRDCWRDCRKRRSGGTGERENGGRGERR